jgi:hypothetical protein
MTEQVQGSNGEQALVKEVSLPLYQSKGWLQLLAVIMILNGIVAAITIIGIIIAWLPIWLGVILFKAASSGENAYCSGDRMQLLHSLNNIKLYFLINGVLMLVLLGLMVVMFFGGMAAILGSM